MRQRARAENLTVCYRKKQMDVNWRSVFHELWGRECFLCVCPVIDNEFRHNIVKVVRGYTQLLPHGSTATLTML